MDSQAPNLNNTKDDTPASADIQPESVQDAATNADDDEKKKKKEATPTTDADEEMKFWSVRVMYRNRNILNLSENILGWGSFITPAASESICPFCGKKKPCCLKKKK